jgi:thiamine-phosphate pyrophosphorylase
MALQLYYITDRSQLPGAGKEQERRLLEKIAECAAAGIDFIQLREKDLSIRALEELARKAMAALGSSRTRLLINSRTDVALACGAPGVHLPASDLAAGEVRAIFSRASRATATAPDIVMPDIVTPDIVTRIIVTPIILTPVIGVSAHSAAEVASAEAHGADFAVFAPVFEKRGTKGGTINREGLEQLRRICHRTDAAQPAMPVLALGGITLENAQQCVAAGAAGIAAIRLFQQNSVDAVVKKLRETV